MYLLTYLIAACFAAPTLPKVGGGDNQMPSQKELIRRLRHNEQLVRSVSCKFEVKVHSTEPIMVDRIAEVVRNRYGDTGNRSYIISPRDADLNCYRVDWLQNRDKVRSITTPLRGLNRRSIIDAYDGQVVRNVRMSENQVTATISTTLNSPWFNRASVDPRSLISCFYSIPWSDVLDRSSRVEMQRVVLADRPAIKVIFDSPFSNEIVQSFIGIFDDNGRWLYREEIGCFGGKDSDPRIIESYEFQDYRPHFDPSGETIWHPYRTIVSYHVGTTTLGLPAVWKKESILVQQVEFNLDIPEEMFVPEIPTNATVIDEINGLGVIPKDQTATAWKTFRPPEESRSWWPILGIATAILAAGITGPLLWRRFRAMM